MMLQRLGTEIIWTQSAIKSFLGFQKIQKLYSRRRISTTLSRSENESQPPHHSTVDVARMLARRIPIIYDEFDSKPMVMLDSSLRGFLPWLEDRDEGRKGILQPGHHLVYYSSAPWEERLMEDGTDDLHAPDASWTHRLWTGGTVRFEKAAPIRLNYTTMSLAEKIEKVQLIGDQKDPEKVLVTVLRRLGHYFASESHKSTRQRLLETPSWNSEAFPIITETRNLAFFRDIPKSFSEQRRIVPPVSPSYSHSLTPTRSLLFRFSALTFNAHAIHLDAEYAKKQYGLPGLVVHGPLTLLLMLQTLDHALHERRLTERTQLPFVIRQIGYKNLAPLFVDEEMTICCKKLRDIPEKKKSDWMSTDLHEGAEEWQVWIQKMQAGEPSLAVRASVLVHPGVDSGREEMAETEPVEKSKTPLIRKVNSIRHPELQGQ